MGNSGYVPYELLKLIESSNNLIISHGLLNADDNTSFNITNNGNLKRIMIGNNCFEKARVFELDGLSELESVVIGESFRNRSSERIDGSFRIVNCPTLKSIHIGGNTPIWMGGNAFPDYNTLELNNLPSLQSISIGNNCFGKVRVFELEGLNELESVVIGGGSFRISDKERNDGSYRVANCPKLESIQIGEESFMDYHSFELNNLPSLQSIDIDGKNYNTNGCFNWAPLFSLTGLIDGLV